MNITLPPPAKGKKDTRENIKWADVRAIGKKAGFSVYQLIILVRDEPTAKKILPKPLRPLYVRVRVLAILGITE
jgi:hypothetical protein